MLEVYLDAHTTSYPVHTDIFTVTVTEPCDSTVLDELTYMPDQELFEVLLPKKVSLTLTVPKDSLSKTSGDLPDGYTFCGARTLNLVDRQTSETLNLATS